MRKREMNFPDIFGATNTKKLVGNLACYYIQIVKIIKMVKVKGI